MRRSHCLKLWAHEVEEGHPVHPSRSVAHQKGLKEKARGHRLHSLHTKVGAVTQKLATKHEEEVKKKQTLLARIQNSISHKLCLVNFTVPNEWLNDPLNPNQPPEELKLQEAVFKQMAHPLNGTKICDYMICDYAEAITNNPQTSKLNMASDLRTVNFR